MPNKKKIIECRYASAQAWYWSSTCAITGFVTVFLSYRNMDDQTIGMTNSLSCLVTILFQLFLSNYCDRHNAKLKKILSLVLMLSIFLSLILWNKSIPSIFLLTAYITVYALSASGNGLLNALMMKYRNAGYSVEYGWPRGVGSIGYALSAYGLGYMIERYRPDILIPAYLVLTLVAVISIISMPNIDDSVSSSSVNKTVSYITMLSKNPILVCFLLAVTICGIAQTAGTTFLIRIIESLSGGTRELGTALLLQSLVELPMMFFSKYLLKKFHAKNLLVFSFVCFSMKVLLITIAPSLSFVYIAMLFNMFCFGIYGISSVVFINDIVLSDQKVRGQALVTICFTGGLGSIIGNALSGFIMENMGLTYLMWISTFISFIAVFVMILCKRMMR